MLEEDRSRSSEEPFLEEVVFEAISGLFGDKMPGLDNFTMAFWHLCWDFTKAEIIALFEDFFRLGTFQRSLNSIFLVLIPKKKKKVQNS